MPFPLSHPPLDRALAERNYHAPTPVQSAVLAGEAAGRDLLVSAQTGSGKTVAYGLAIAAELLGDRDRFSDGGAPLALIVAPTRELALQVHRELAWLYQYAGARVVSCVGGMDPRHEQRELAAGAHIVVGTPGRLCDHLRRGRFDVTALKAVVLDEADEMLDMGFREDMEALLEATPDTRRTLLFSATLPRGIVALAREYQHDAFRIEVGGDEGGHADIEYRAIKIAPGDVEHAVINILRFFESPGAIVFCNTRNAVRHLQASLLERGFSVVALSGELTQNERTTALQALRDGHARVCVATDVAARGIDLPNLGLVINADLPNDPEVMQHRSGRTGRAGRKGVSVLLVPPARKRRAELLLNLAGIDAIWGTAPTPDEIRKLDQERMMKDTLFAEEPSEDDLTLARMLLAERSPEDIATALARLYRARLPSPEDILDPGERVGRSREDRSARRDDRAARGDERGGVLPLPSAKSQRRDAMADGSVWFRAGIGRQKNAEARWLLPMICRRGGIDKNDIGAIRIFDSTTEFEISAHAAEQFAARIKRPDKEDNIRIEALPDGPQGDAPRRDDRPKPYARPKSRDDHPGIDAKPAFAKRSFDTPRRHEAKPDHKDRREGKVTPRADRADMNASSGFERKPPIEAKPFDKPRRHEGKSERAGYRESKPAQRADTRSAKPAFGKKPKKKNKKRG